jgi:DNA polymerase-3 subunit alpha
MSYTSLHNHTEYSNLRLLDCINKVEDIIQYAHDIGLKGMAITDHEALSAHIKALRYYKQKKKDDETWNDFKLILGNEIYLCRDGLSAETYEKGEKFPHFILLAKDEIGHGQLRELSTRAWKHSFTMFLTRTPTYYQDVEEIVKRNPGHLVASSACVGGWLGICKMNGAEHNARAFIKWCKDLFGDDFYLELQPARYQEQIDYNKWLIWLGKETDTKCIITTDSHYLKKEDREVHSSFLNSKDGDRETAEFYQYTYMMTPEEIISLMNDYIEEEVLKEMLDNTNEINDKIAVYDLAQPQIVPHLSDDRVKHPEWKIWFSAFKIRDKFEYLNKYYNSPSEDDRYMLYLGLMKLHEMNLPQEKKDQYLERLEQELTECWLVSERLGQSISSYLLMVRNIIQIMWDKAESLVGISRGSAGVMLINYLIGVTQMNPLEQGIYLPHWRFLERNKIELPDIDVDSEGRRRPVVLQKIKEAAQADGGDSTCVCTFGTLGTRSAILTAARGLGIDVDVAQYLATMIPQERGFLWPLKDCIQGNPEKDRKPIKQLIEEFKKYPGFLEMAKAIEGLVCQMGIHACGLVVFNVPVYTYNAMMKAPNGTEVTQFDLGDTEYMGGLKMDCLSVEALDKIHTTLDLLLADNMIEWQGTLKSTYDKYLHPDVLDRDAPEMWHKIWRNEIIDIFQMDSTVGKQSLSLVKPESIPQMAAVNSLMRLVPEKGQKTPTEEYVIYKQHPELIKKEIDDLVATDEEKEILYEFMKQYTGVLESQESAMLAVMLPFTNYDVPHANKIRKIIAKKKMKEITSARAEYFQTGLDNGVSEDILRYIWDVQIKRQLGYSFSIPHTVAYSLIALQEMNLNYKFPSIYWATACLTVNSGGADEESGGTTNYGKLSSAIGRIKRQGIGVELPDINKAKFGFTPDQSTNSIIYGMKGISEVGDDIINKIISNRPFTNFQDFLDRVGPGKVQTIALIKAGCFDKLENQGRKELLYEYLSILIPRKNKLTLANVNGLINYNILPKNKSAFIYLFNFNKYLKLNKKDDRYYIDERAYQYFSKNFDVNYLGTDKKKTYIEIKVWDTLYKDRMMELKEYITKNQEKLIDKLHAAEIDEIWQQYCSGTLSTWEMDTLGFYYHDHDLLNTYHPEFKFGDFYEMSEIPIASEYHEYKGRKVPVFELQTIYGTVLDKNSYKHTVVLLTPTGVVNVKCVAEQYSKYDKQLSQPNPETGKKEVIERSWFKRGTNLIVNGWRNADQFMARGRQAEGKYPIYKILESDDCGLLNITRYRADD